MGHRFRRGWEASVEVTSLRAARTKSRVLRAIDARKDRAFGMNVRDILTALVL